MAHPVLRSKMIKLPTTTVLPTVQMTQLVNHHPLCSHSSLPIFKVRTWRPVEPGAHITRVAVLPGRPSGAAAAAVVDHDGVAKVAEAQLPPGAVDEQVGRLDVAVADAVAAVQVLEGAEHLRGVRHGVLVRQAACRGGDFKISMVCLSDNLHCRSLF